MKALNILVDENPLPKEFDCKKCHSDCKAMCCSNVPLPKNLLKRNKKLFNEPVLRYEPLYDAVIPITKSGKCPFLNKDYSCAIYKWRPAVCRLFGTEVHENMKCPYMDKNGTKRNPYPVESKNSEADARRASRLIDTIFRKHKNRGIR
jgi:Fe-S-cluster containining protein